MARDRVAGEGGKVGEREMLARGSQRIRWYTVTKLVYMIGLLRGGPFHLSCRLSREINKCSCLNFF